MFSGRAASAAGVGFAHDSERQFAELLDFYGIPWLYEPRTFPIEWDGQGNPTRSFTPDFYLPDENLFIEITTMNQKLVTKKNRKVRLLRSLYPEIECKIFYQRDVGHLQQKYGMDAATMPRRQPGPPEVTRVPASGSA